jgi:diguanylate cyclase (GGDEF)-like protein
MNSAICSARSDQSAALMRYLWLCLLCLLALDLTRAQAETVPLNQHWEYRWGDSPFKDDTPVWTIEADEAQWHPISFPSNPPGRDGRENIWYRTQIPEDDWRDPVLYIFSVDLIFEVYLEGERIYHYGEFDAQGKGRFEGWPWHMIPLPEDAAGKPIHFRVYSNYMDIGLWGEVKIMDRLELYQQILKESIDSLIITLFNLLIAALALLFALFKSGRLTLLALGLFSLASAGLALSTSQAKQLLFNHALMWEYIGAGSYYLLPIALALMLQAWFGRLRWLYRSLVGLFLLYLIGALGLSLVGVVSLANTYPLFDLLFAVLVPVMLLCTVYQLPQANSDQRIMLLATTTLTLLLLVDMAVAHGWISWSRIPVGWGSLMFSLAIVALSLRHFIHTQNALAHLNATLENRVVERTSELKILARREADRARALEFGNRKRALLDKMISAMEQSETAEHAIKRMAAHLPDLCEPLPGGLYRSTQHHWELELHWCQETLPSRYALTDTPRPEGDEWHSFRIEYEDPRNGSQLIGMLVVNLDSRNINFEQLNPLTLQNLFLRAVDRINLTLSKVVLQQALSRFSYEDALTGLNNRRFLDEMLSREVALAHRNHSPLTVMICDIDHFKRLNDTYGHAAGDEVLKSVARLLRTNFRETDIICRFGGEEFVVVMPAATLQDCQDRAEQLRASMASQTFTYGTEMIGPVTLSAGISALNPESDTADDLLRRADNALYQAKAGGRNRVISADAKLQP